MSDQEFLFKKSTIYPFNHTKKTESGHSFEFDDNKGSERIRLQHKSGSEIEFHPNADCSHTILGSFFSTIYSDNCTHVWGAKTLTINRELKLIVSAETLEKEDEDKEYNLDVELGKGSTLNITVKKGNCNIILDEGDVNFISKKGEVNLCQHDGNFKHYVNGNYRLEVTGQMEVVVGQNYISKIKKDRYTEINGKLDWLNMTNSDAHLELTGNKQATIMNSDIFLKSNNFISRSEEQTIMQTGIAGQGEFTISSMGDINISSGWDHINKSKSSNNNPQLNLFANKTTNGGNLSIFTDNEFHVITNEECKFNIKGGKFHVKVDELKTNWTESSSPETPPEELFSQIYNENYIRVQNYDLFLEKGFPVITIDKIII